MQFLSTVLSEVEPRLNANNLKYKNDIDIKIINGNTIVGFIISTVSPVRFIGVYDFGCHGNAFDEYRLHIGSEYLDFIYENDTHTIPNLETNDTSSTQPYISTSDDIILYIDTTSNVEIEGGIYDPNIRVDFGPEVNINNFVSIEPTKLIVNVTTTSNIQTATPIVMTRYGQYHFGKTPMIEVSEVVIGNGENGIFLTDFNNGLTGQKLWGDNWKLDTEGKIDSIDGFFKSSSSTTPSSGTGPNNSYDSFFMFTERSGSNYGVGQRAIAATNNFKDLTEVKFVYHMFGSGLGDLELESQNADSSWVSRWNQIGQKQARQSDPFESVTLDTTSWDCKAIRFVFDNTTSYAADIAIDNIQLTSV